MLVKVNKSRNEHLTMDAMEFIFWKAYILGETYSVFLITFVLFTTSLQRLSQHVQKWVKGLAYSRLASSILDSARIMIQTVLSQIWHA